MFADLFAENGAALRAWLEERTPELLHGLIAQAPVWSLVLFALVVMLAAIWAVIQLFEGAAKGGRFLLNPAEGVKEIIAPEPVLKKRDLADVKDQIAQVKAQLDRLAAQNVAQGSEPINDAARERRDAAAAEIVTELTPASSDAARELASGDVTAAIAILERDARTDKEAAAEKWRRIGALMFGVDNAKAREAYTEAFRLQPSDFWTCYELALLHWRAADLDAAKEVALAAERAARDDRERASAADVMGLILAEMGDLDTAIEHCKAALDLATRWAHEDPDADEAQRDLYLSHSRLGEMLREAGDLEGALAQTEAAFEIAERLARDNPDAAQAQRDLAIMHSELSTLHNEMEDLDAAKACGVAALDILENLNRKAPDTVETQRDLSLGYNRLGDILRRAGDLGGARKLCEQSLEIAKRIAHDFPDSAQEQRDLTLAFERLGDVLEAQGDISGAVALYDQSLSVASAIAAANPSHAGFAKEQQMTEERLAALKEKI